MFEKIKEDFPIFYQKINKGLIYLDSAATSQKPQKVLYALNNFYINDNANAHRGVYRLGDRATQHIENTRKLVAKFIGAENPEQIIFTRGSTESCNHIAYGWAKKYLNENDEIVITEVEHHSNLIPWQEICRETGARLRFIPYDEKQEYMFNYEDLDKIITPKTKLVSVIHSSNVLGKTTKIKKIIKLAHAVGAKVVIDGAQFVPHHALNIKEINPDFYFFSGHKMLAPFGIGVLYASEQSIIELEPTFYGGSMIDNVSYQKSSWAKPPWKFEAGTQNLGGIVGLGAAIEYLTEIGMDNVNQYCNEISDYALEKIKKIDGVKIHGGISKNTQRNPLISFEIENIHPHDVATFFDSKNIAIRAGHHCTKILMKKLQVTATCRASFYIYNDKKDADKLIQAIIDCKNFFTKIN